MRLIDRFGSRPAAKNHTRSRTIGPPNVPSYMSFRLLVRVTSLSSSNGVSSVHDGLVRFDTKAAGEPIAATLGDGVHDAAREAAELGRDAGREDLRFLDGLFDEQFLRCPADVVVDVDAVDHEQVVERRRRGSRSCCRGSACSR